MTNTQARTALGRVEATEGDDHLDERVGGEIGHGLRIGAAPGEERGDGIHLRPVDPLELGRRLTAPGRRRTAAGRRLTAGRAFR